MRTKSGTLALAAAGALAISGAAAAQVWEVGNQLLELPSPQFEAHFGSALAVGDFDGDGRDDLAVGAPDWGAGSSDFGAVYVFRGQADRTLTDWWNVVPETVERMGSALAAGDFNGDGRDDLAIGRPDAEVVEGGDPYPGAGMVTIFEWDGAAWEAVQDLKQSTALFIDTPETNDGFGSRLAVGNFNGDAYEDLVVGVPFEDLVGVQGEEFDAGMVHVFLGTSSGVHPQVEQHFVAGSGGVLGTRGAFDEFGSSLAAGDFNGDGYQELAIGAPLRNVSSIQNAGQVHVLFGSASGLVVTGNQLLDESSFGNSLGESEEFGFSLASAKFDQTPFACVFGPCYDDLAIGVPGQDWSPLRSPEDVADQAGKVIVAYGGASGLGTSGQTELTQADVASATPESGDWFGNALTSGGLDSAGLFSAYDDLAVGAPTENVGGSGLVDDGYVQLFFGSSGGVDGGAQEQAFTQKPGFAIAPAEDNDQWGTSLAIGDFDGDGWGDLVVGVPFKDRGLEADSGAVQILYGALFADGFESGGSTNW